MSLWQGLRELLGSWWGSQPSYQPLYFTIQSVYLARAYYVAAELGIADRLAEGPLSVSELAMSTQANEEHLLRLLRALASFGVFAEGADGRFRITPRAEPLKTGDSGPVRDWLVLTGSLPTWLAFGHAVDVVRSGRNGFALSKQGANDLYEYSDRDPDYSHTFIRAQASWTQWHAESIVTAYDFSRFRRVIDVGGGRGVLMTAILTAAPGVEGILVDRPLSVEQARRGLEQAGVAERCELVVGDFFKVIPSGGDLYVIKHVLRDWDDDHAAQILTACYRAMDANAKLLVIDAVLDPRNGCDRVTKLLDLEQMFWLNGKLRTRQEWVALLDKCGFHLVASTPTKIVDVTLLEARRRG